MNQLTLNDFADVIVSTIRFAIDRYYQDHHELTIESFLDTLKTEQRELMEQSILQDTLWKKKTIFTDEDVKECIDVVLEASDKRRIAEINDLLKDLNDINDALSRDKQLLMKEKDAIKMRLQNKTKEE
jgi:hypothetical protein